jgi:hypothetical protein
MPSIEAFNDFVKSTGPKVLKGPDQLLNDATKNTYLLGRMLKGGQAALSLQSGQKVIERIQLSDSGTFQFYDPNSDLDIQNVDVLRSIEAPWRFAVDHYSYTEQEVTLNSGDPQTYYKNLLKSKRQACSTSMYNGMEEALWAAPSNAKMEAASATNGVPYSIPALITSNGLAPSGFNTLVGLDPSTETGWRNQTETYDPSNKVDPEVGLLHAMSRMFHKCRFVAPMGGMREYFENDRLQKMVICTNLDGRTLYERITRDSNDRLVPNNDAGWTAGVVVYNGIPVEYIAQLDTALVNSGSAITSGQPWFYYLNLEYLHPIFHTTQYMTEKEPKSHPRQPFSYVVWKSTYYQLMPTSRRRQGLITPA